MSYRQSLTDASTMSVNQHYGNAGHGGIDLGLYDGSTYNGPAPIYAPAAGTVVWTQQWDGHTITGNQSWGNMVTVQFGENQYYLIAHMLALELNERTVLQQGQYIGRQGTTGNSSGPHVHLEYWNGGFSTAYRTDPTPLIGGIPNIEGIYEMEWDAENPPGPPGPPGPGPSRKALPLMYYVRHPIFRI